MPVRNYIWDVVSDNLLMEMDNDDNTIASYEHEPGLHGKLISQHRNGQTYYYHCDGMGNTVAITDENQNVVESATYSAFGEVVQKTSSIVNPFSYKGALGYYVNPATNDLYVRARVYDPVTGRWQSIDPLRFEDGSDGSPYSSSSTTIYADRTRRNAIHQSNLSRFASWGELPANGQDILDSVAAKQELSKQEKYTRPYEYVYNNPVNLADPSGLAPCDPPEPLIIAELKLDATIYCLEGKFDVIVFPGKKWDRCVEKCIREHEKVHIRQWEGFCPDWCKRCGNDQMVPANPEGVTRTEVECPAYLKERDCLEVLYYISSACDPRAILARIREVDLRAKQFNCQNWPPPWVK